MRRFTAAAVALFVMFAAAGVPTTLLPALQAHWGFGTYELTLAFGVYSGSTILGLLVFGKAADVVGRKPIILVAVLLQLMSLTAFVIADHILDVILARVLQGFSVGMATSALSALIVESIASSATRIGTVLIAVIPAASLGVGAFGIGIALMVTKNAELIVFGVLGLLVLLSAVVIVAEPDTVRRHRGLLKAMKPSLRVPAQARREYFGTIPVIVSGWMLGGLSLGLIPTALNAMLGIESSFIHGLAVLIQTGAVAIAGIAFRRVRPRTLAIFGSMATVAGYLLVTAALFIGQLNLIMLALVIVGLGYGISFTGVMGLLENLTSIEHRAGLFSAVYSVAYLAFGLPAILLGVLTRWVSIESLLLAYSLIGMLIALVGQVWQLRLARGRTD